MRYDFIDRHDDVFIYYSILRNLWVQIVGALKVEYDKLPHSSNNSLHFRLSYILLNLSDFFEADGNGLARRYIESEVYMVSYQYE